MAHPTNVDIEMGIHRLRGYPSLAAFIASTGDGDKTTLIFKRFDELAARNLLYLQSQLAQLESQLGQFDQDDLRGDMDAKSRARNWQKFSTAAAEHTNGREQSRMELIMQIRKIMKEYRQALLFESTLASIPPPRKTVLEAFRLVFHNGQLGADESFPTLGGHDRALYDNREDLVTLKVQENQDRLTTFVQDRLGGLFPVSEPPATNRLHSAE